MQQQHEHQQLCVLSPSLTPLPLPLLLPVAVEAAE
jgi:hypothetical protein